jgi:hypothetical protein
MDEPSRLIKPPATRAASQIRTPPGGAIGKRHPLLNEHRLPASRPGQIVPVAASHDPNRQTSMNQAAVILTNYRRPDNVPRQLELLAGARGEFDFIVIDNADRGHNLRSRITVEDWYVYVENRANLGAGYRFLISCGLPYDAIIAIDDDVFLGQDQLALIHVGIRREPSRVHGVWGQDLTKNAARRELPGGYSHANRTASVISRVYGYTPRIAFKAMAIARQMGFDSWKDIGPTDDILLSAASEGAPICHGIDRLSVCETSNTEGIATWKTAGFDPARTVLIDKLLAAHLLQH